MRYGELVCSIERIHFVFKFIDNDEKAIMFKKAFIPVYLDKFGEI